MVNFITKYFKKERKLKENTRTIILNQAPIGYSGTNIYSGYIYEDYLNAMNGSRRAEEYDKMIRSDYNISMCLNAIINPILSATWEIVPGEDTPEAIADADLVRHILFTDMRKPFDTFLTEALSFIPFGFQVFEIIHQVVTNHPIFKNYIGINTLAWRSPKTIEAWNVDKNEQLISVLQQSEGDTGKTVNIPAEFLLVFNTGAKGSNFEGVGWLRAAYGPYKRKNLYLKLNAAGIEKYSIPTPTVEVPAGKENSPEFLNLIRVLQAYTSHESNYLTYPAGWNVKLNPNQGFDPSKIEASIDSEDKRTTRAFLANFLELGMNSSGAYALSNDLSDFFLGGIVHLANEICKKMNQKVITDIVQLNKGPRSTYPQLKASNINDKAGKELADILSVASNANIIIPDDQLEDHFRKRFNLPPRSEEGQRKKTALPAFGLTEKVVRALRRNK